MEDDWREARKRYKIERLYFKGGKRLIMSGLTKAEAKAHCSDPESSSSTCTSKVGRARTRKLGAWFDSYSED